MTDLATSADNTAANDTTRVDSNPAATTEADQGESESLTDALSEAFDRASAAGETEDETPETEAEKTQRQRDEQGRFKAKTDAEKPADDATAKDGDKDKPAAEGDKPVEAEAAPPTPVVPPPARMDKRFHDDFAKTSPDFQKYLAEREKNFDRYVSSTAEPKKFYEHMGQVYSQFQPMFEASNVDFATGVSNLLAREAARARDPATAILEDAQAYGIDLLDLVEKQGDVPRIDPKVSALEAEINRLNRQLQGVTGHLSEQSRAEQEARDRHFDAKVLAFRDKVGRAEFDELVEDIDLHMNRIRARADRPSTIEAMLEQALEAARWSNPAAREKRLAAEKANAEAAVKAEREKIEAEKKKAEEVRKAATRKASNAAAVNVRAAPPNSVALSLGDELSLAYDRAMNGAAH